MQCGGYCSAPPGPLGTACSQSDGLHGVISGEYKGSTGLLLWEQRVWLLVRHTGYSFYPLHPFFLIGAWASTYADDVRVYLLWPLTFEEEVILCQADVRLALLLPSITVQTVWSFGRKHPHQWSAEAHFGGLAALSLLLPYSDQCHRNLGWLKIFLFSIISFRVFHKPHKDTNTPDYCRDPALGFEGSSYPSGARSRQTPFRRYPINFLQP